MFLGIDALKKRDKAAFRAAFFFEKQNRNLIGAMKKSKLVC
jgi:hypothetical protein